MYNLKKFVPFCNVLQAHFKQRIKKWIKKLHSNALPDDAVERRKLGVNKVRKNHSST